MTEMPMTPWQVVAGPESAGIRLDRFLAESIGRLSRSRVKALIMEGAAERDGTIHRDPAHLVRPGVCYTLREPPPVAATPAAQPIPLHILYEDADLIVLDKQAGLVVHPAPGNQDGTLVNAILAHCGDGLPGIGGERRPGIVHRLDKDTSGVMVIAKTEQALGALSGDFAKRNLQRHYLALCWGLPTPGQGDIEGAIGRDPRDRKRMALVDHGGKSALTHYRVMKTWVAASLLECRLATGRTHQIRVHLAAKGHPLVGDPVYLRRIPASARSLADPARGQLLDFPRQALHAASLGFCHPRTGRSLLFTAPIPADFAELITALDKQA